MLNVGKFLSEIKGL